jgi:polar amino acid transport system substrate-binding protein
VISTLGKNAEREKVIDFSSAYAPFFQAVYAAKSMNIKSFADMAGKTVAVTRGAMEDQELAKVAPANVDYRRFEDNNATIAAFVAGQTQMLAPAPRSPATCCRRTRRSAPSTSCCSKTAPASSASPRARMR